MTVARLRPHRSRWGAGLGVALLAVSLAGCSLPGAGSDEEQIVTEFFQHLIDGDATAAGQLLADRSVVSDVALDDDVYAQAVRPVEAHVTSTTGSSPDVSIAVEYTLDGEEAPRTIVITMTEVDGEPRIENLSDGGLYLDGQGIPADLTINEDGVFSLGETQPLLLLPGIYDLEYTDADGIATLDPDGGDAEPFAVEFPVDAAAIVPPDGAEMVSKIMVLHPVLRTAAADELQTSLDDALASCAASALLGAECPSIISDGVRNRAWEGAVDPSTVVWHQDEPLALQGGDVVKAGAAYTVTFSWPSGPQTVETDLVGAVQRDASGAVVIDLD